MFCFFIKKINQIVLRFNQTDWWSVFLSPHFFSSSAVFKQPNLHSPPLHSLPVITSVSSVFLILLRFFVSSFAFPSCRLALSLPIPQVRQTDLFPTSVMSIQHSVMERKCLALTEYQELPKTNTRNHFFAPFARNGHAAKPQGHEHEPPSILIIIIMPEQCTWNVNDPIRNEYISHLLKSDWLRRCCCTWYSW